MVFSLAMVFAFVLSVIGVSAAAPSVTIQLTPNEAGSKAVGTGTITDNGDGTITVVVKETNLEPGVHINHIHSGSCAAQGPIVYPLTNLTADADGNATMTTKVNVSFAKVTAGGLYLNVHNLAKASTSCGNIVAAPAAGGQGGADVAPAGAPATGQGGAANGGDLPLNLGLIAIFGLVIAGSSVALARSGKSR
jgi:hypothetical protein